MPSLTTPPHVPADLVFDFDIYRDPRIDADIQGSYARALREAPDIFYTPRNGGHWVARRMEPVTAIMKDNDHFSAREMHIPRIPDPPLLLPINLDPPESFPYRHAMAPLFSQSGVRRLEPRIRHWAERLVGEVAATGACDFVTDVASLFPVSIFMEFMGLPLEDLRPFRALSNEFFSSHDPETIASASGRIMDILAREIRKRRIEPGDDLISLLTSTESLGRPMRDDEILASAFLLFLGGMDTVTNLLSFSFRYLAGDPELQARLVADPDTIPPFIEECLRCFPVINPSRLVIRDCDTYGPPMREGDMIICLLSEAGRDDRANPEPHRFDIDREDASHLGFSAGAHFCIGHLLARSEIRILLEEWLKRIPAFTAQPAPAPAFRMGAVLAIESAPLQWTPALAPA